MLYQPLMEDDLVMHLIDAFNPTFIIILTLHVT
jgi:hypothetical protein